MNNKFNYVWEAYECVPGFYSGAKRYRHFRMPLRIPASPGLCLTFRPVLWQMNHSVLKRQCLLYHPIPFLLLNKWWIVTKGFNYPVSHNTGSDASLVVGPSQCSFLKNSCEISVFSKITVIQNDHFAWSVFGSVYRGGLYRWQPDCCARFWL